jgi:ADP-heptose:LPS heptosyltransferase
MEDVLETPLLARANIDSVVVFRALQLGDMLCAMPALQALRAALPRARIVLVGLPWAAQLAQRYSDRIDEFVAFPGHPDLPEQPVRHERIEEFYDDMKRRRFSLALQLHGSGIVSNGIVAAFGARLQAGFAPTEVGLRASAHSGFEPADRGHGSHIFHLPYIDSGPEPLRLLRLMRWLGAPVSGDGLVPLNSASNFPSTFPSTFPLTFPLTPADRDELLRSGAAEGLRPGGYICIHPGARTRDKCWPAARFAEVADLITAESGLGVVLTGGPGEADLTASVAAHMRSPVVDTAVRPLSIGAMAALMNGARLLICNDTGVSHIAAGLRLPSVVIFSVADMTRWAPLDGRLHRCIRDPSGEQGEVVLHHARELLALSRPPATGPAPAR